MSSEQANEGVVSHLPACPPPTPHSVPAHTQAKTRKLVERKVSRAELEEMERRRRAEEAEDRGAVMRDLRCVRACRRAPLLLLPVFWRCAAEAAGLSGAGTAGEPCGAPLRERAAWAHAQARGWQAPRRAGGGGGGPRR